METYFGPPESDQVVLQRASDVIDALWLEHEAEAQGTKTRHAVIGDTRSCRDPTTGMAVSRSRAAALRD